MKAYAVKHKDESIRIKSRSGGAFTAVSDLFLDGGCVYGCVLNDDLSAVHIRATSAAERDRMRGSKYVQSNMGDCFKLVKKDLEDGIRVLFSGTPCQIAGLKSFLNKEYDNLYCADIICRGVPCRRVWKDYLKWISRGEKIISADFRNKADFGWEDHVETVTTDRRKVNSKVFRNLFMSNMIIRPACYECQFKSLSRAGDITLGDFWGIKESFPDFYDKNGISLVLVNDEKGEELFRNIAKDISYIECDIDKAMQNSLRSPFPEPCDRSVFWKEYNERGFEYIAVKYGDHRPGLSEMIRSLTEGIFKSKRIR